MGLIAIFAAAPIPIAVMGGVLEVSKLVVTSWLYRSWEHTSFLIRSYFITAVCILMLLTSMGIFGFLSKAHMDQNLVSGDVLAKMSIIEEKIKIEKENIDAARKTLNQLDIQVNETISRTGGTNSTGTSGVTRAGTNSGATGVERSIAIRRSQAKERDQAQKAILSSQETISRLNAEKAPIAAEVRKVEAEVGPIKYIAALIYDNRSTDQDTLEKAVRWVILLIVFVFDPLAVLMFIAFNQDVKRRENKTDAKQEVIDTPIEKKEESKAMFNIPSFKMPEFAMPEFKMPSFYTAREDRKEKPKHDIEYEKDRVLIPVVDTVPEGGDNAKFIREAKNILVK
jgi:hypothetical protein